ncbi:ABC-2 type transport system permease protein [Sinosporangium album]|uniref:ABC-2 type transport system permease protein n=1 Tax=Sinosporangium album TaxID=504805 RepID=A0A1G8IAC9_9ACTN|nr:ABC transporter permease [Sinosporangium album]SDI15797.1 ABC-2 type transport system permease protein [Sinosporangium album]
MSGIMRLGPRRGIAEFGTMVRDRKELYNSILGSAGIYALLAVWLRDRKVAGTDVDLSTYMMAGMMALVVFQIGLMNLPMMIAADREEGALLRLRTVPGGIGSFLIGRAVSITLAATLQIALILAIGLAVGGASLPASPGHWLTLAWVLPLGMLAVVPLGAALGALLPNPRTAGAVLGLPVMGLLIISGAMFPVTAMPEAVRWVAQAFPLYWQGHGIRAALLSDSTLAAEIGGTWRLAESAGILALWLVAGMVLAPRLLRRATRGAAGTRSPVGS